MIIGIGVDVVELARFAAALERAPRLRERFFGEAERALPPASLAARFAAREAAVKALGGIRGLSLRDFEVTGGAGSRPEFRFSPAAQATLAGLGVARVHLSLSHDAGIATAFVVAEGPG